MGYSFAAGTVDGPGAFNFEQGLYQLYSFAVCIYSGALNGTIDKCPDYQGVLISEVS